MHRTARVSVLLLLVAALLPLKASAQAPVSSMQGTFTYTAQGSDDVSKAIEAVVRQMNFVKRPIARGRLTKTNQPYRSVTITHNASNVSIVTDNRPAIVTPANGSPIKWRREDGEMFDVSTEWENGTLEQTFVAGDGKRVNSFVLSPDGNTLTMTVTVSSPQLPKPLVYKLNFRRTR